MIVRLVTEPSVFLVGRQQVDDAALTAFLESEGVESWTTDTDVAGQKLVEAAGRTCYLSFARPRPGGNAAYIGHLLDVGHGSVLEHAVFNLIITGVSRSFTHELVRHRAGFGFSQLSQRYVDESDCAFVVPPALADEVAAARRLIASFGPPAPRPSEVFGLCGDKMTVEAGAGLRWLASVDHARRDYAYLTDYLAQKITPPYRREPGNSFQTPTIARYQATATEGRKIAREAARSVLPNCTETKIFVTANARALRHFIEMRASDAADAEIRRVALAVLRLLQAEAPALFGDYELVPINASGDVAATTKHRKV